MDISSAKAELATLQLKNSVLVTEVKSSNRNLTDAEAAQLEKDADRVLELKGFLTYCEKHDVTDGSGMKMHSEDDGTFEPFDALDDESASRSHGGVKAAKGYLSPAAISRTVRAGAADGAKAILAGGSTATAVALDANPVQLGKPGVNLGLLNVIAVTKRSTPKYSFLRQTGRVNNAAVVATGAQKPTSGPTLTTIENKLDVVAHVSEYIDRYLLRDNANLEQFVQSELADGIFQKVTALGVTTFAGTAGTTTQAFQGNAMDSIYLAAGKAADLGYQPDLLLISRADYDTILLAKDTAGNYLYRNPQDSRLNGLQPIIVSGLAAKTALVLDSNRVGISTDNIGLVAEWDKLTRLDYNEARLLVEARFAFDVYQPASIVKVGTAA